jgi:hypothetical protein
MVSPRESCPLLTSERATPPLKALAALATRVRSFGRMGCPVSMLRTPKAWTSLCWPRWTMAMTPGGPPCLATRDLRAPSSAAPGPFPWAPLWGVPVGVTASAIPLARSTAVATAASSRTDLLIYPAFLRSGRKVVMSDPRPWYDVYSTPSADMTPLKKTRQKHFLPSWPFVVRYAGWHRPARMPRTRNPARHQPTPPHANDKTKPPRRSIGPITHARAPQNTKTPTGCTTNYTFICNLQIPSKSF